MTHIARATYAIIAYLVGLAGLAYFVLFIGAWDFLPNHIDSAGADRPALALAINIGLILLFGLQHSIMARPGFKKAWTKLIPAELERSTYVLLSGLFMFVIAFFWQPMEGTLWSSTNSALGAVLLAVYALGFVVIVASSFIINHFELFGLLQVYDRIMGREESKIEFTEAFLYTAVRHPIQLGILMCMWSTPVMSVSHLVLASSMSVYMLIGLYFEERDLIRCHGAKYEDYRRRVNKLLPFPKLAPQTSSNELAADHN